MARYGLAFKDRAVARSLPPESSEVADVARELGISVQALERWRAVSVVYREGAYLALAARRLIECNKTASSSLALAAPDAGRKYRSTQYHECRESNGMGTCLCSRNG